MKTEHINEPAPVSLTPIQNREFKRRLKTIIYAELILLVKSLSWLWYLIIVGLNINTLSAPAKWIS